MGVEVSEMKLFRALTNNDGSSNGGRESYNEIVSGIMNNLFPNVSHAERVAGITRYRKMFLHNIDDEQYWLYDARFWVDKISLAEDYFRLAIGTATDVQGDIGAYKWHGTGRITEAITPGGSTIKINMGDTDLVGVLAPGDIMYLTAKKSIDDVGHNDEFVEVDTVVQWLGSVVEITTVDPIQGTYPISYVDGAETYYSRCGMVLSFGDLRAYVDNYIVTSVGGTYDDVGNPVEGDNESSVEDTITVTFTDPTNFIVAGSYLGSLGSGSIGSNFAPTNPSTGRPYFTIPSTGWGGSWLAADTLEFDLHPASAAIWVKEEVPAASDAFANNIVEVAFYGESGPEPQTTTTTTAPPVTTTTVPPVTTTTV